MDTGGEGMAGETRIVIPLEGTNADGSPRQVVIVVPAGVKLDAVDRQAIVDDMMRAARRRGSA